MGEVNSMHVVDPIEAVVHLNWLIEAGVHMVVRGCRAAVGQPNWCGSI